MDTLADARYLSAWGRDRREIEAYLYGGNEIIAEYEMEGLNQNISQSYIAIIECTAGDGFGVKAQYGRLSSGLPSKGPSTLAEVTADVEDRLGARLVSFRGQDVAQPGPLSRLSGLAAPAIDSAPSTSESALEAELER